MRLRTLLLLLLFQSALSFAVDVPLDAPNIVHEFMKSGNQFATKGMPHATSNIHDKPAFKLNRSQGFPGAELAIEFGGSYQYIKNGRWRSEAIHTIAITWGDEGIEVFRPTSYPFEAKHRFGINSNFKIIDKVETSHDIQIVMTTLNGNTFRRSASYTTHLNRSGYGTPSGPSERAKDYWKNDDCVMIDSICYLEEVIVHKSPYIDVPVDLNSTSPWSFSPVSYYSGIEFNRKTISCSPPWQIVNNRCQKSETHTEPPVYEYATRVTHTYNEQDFSFQYVDYTGGPPVFGTVTYRDSWMWFQSFRVPCTTKNYSFIDNRPNAPIRVFMNCVREIEYWYCTDINKTPYLSAGQYVCSETPGKSTTTTEYLPDWDRCMNPAPSLGHGVVPTDVLQVTADFYCFDSITVKEVCKSPFQPAGSECEWKERIRTPVYDQTADDTPLDTYRR